MNKKAISVTLSPDNLLWLQARMIMAGNRSLSETLDRLVRDARASSGQLQQGRSAVGMVRMPDDDPDLRKAGREVRELFEKSLSRPIAPPAAGQKKSKRKPA